jgi:hypothetical protein
MSCSVMPTGARWTLISLLPPLVAIGESGFNNVPQHIEQLGICLSQETLFINFIPRKCRDQTDRFSDFSLRLVKRRAPVTW